MGFFWRLPLFTEFEDEPSYGVALRGARGKENLTQKERENRHSPESHLFDGTWQDDHRQGKGQTARESPSGKS